MDTPHDAPKNEKELALERTNLAQQRTDLAYQRTLLANERTFSAWVRTGLTAVAAGVGIGHLLNTPNLRLAARIIGGIFIIFGTGAFIIGLWRYFSQYRRLALHGVKLTPIWILTILMLSLLMASIIAWFILWQ